MSTTAVPAASLILDYTIYPRHKLDRTNLRNLSNALEAGEALPPIVADQASRRVVDGFHRVTSVLRRDSKAEIDTDMRDYGNDGEMFLDAVKRNSRHGQALTSFDHARVVTVGEAMHLGAKELAAAMAMPIATIDKIRVTRIAFKPSGEPVNIKRSFSRFQNMTLTEEQVIANASASGWSAVFHANEIVKLITADAVDLTDEVTRLHLEELRDLLIEVLSHHA